MSAISTTGRAALVAASVGSRVPRDRDGRARRPAEPPQGDLSHAETQRGGERRDCCQCKNVANTQSQYPIGIGNNGTGNTSTMATFSSLPKGWDVRRLKSILRPHKKLVGKRCNEYDLLSLTLRGIVKRDMENPEGKFPASFETYQEVNSGDFVFCMFDNEETPRAVGLSSLRGMITGAYDVMSLIAEGVSREFLNYYFLWVDDGKRLKPLYKGLRKTVPLDSFLAYKISLPPLPEQKAIVAYLDAETGRIDKAIAAEEKMIALLQERREIVINEAVGGGDLSHAEAQRGRVRRGWEAKRFKNLFSTCTGISFTKAELVEEGCPVLSYGQIHSKENPRVGVNRKLIRHIPAALITEKSLAYKGDFLFADTSEDLEGCGNCICVDTDEPIYAGSHVILARKHHEQIGRFLAYEFASVTWRTQLRKLVNGVKVYSVTQTILNSVPVWLLPLPEQEAIVERLDRETGKIDRAIEVKRRQIELLRERRQIVIDEVVTGKVKVA